MEYYDKVVQIFSDVEEVNSNFFIYGNSTNISSNVISEALEYWRVRKDNIISNLSSSDTSGLKSKLKFASIISIHVIDITPR